MFAGVKGFFKSVSAAATDAYFNLVTLLLPGNGTNGAQNNTFLDSSTNNFTITRNGNTTQGTFSPFSQTGWSNYFDGNGDYIQTTMTQTVSGNYTFECWIYLTAAYSSSRACMFGDGGSGAWEFDIDGSSGAWNKLNIYFGGAGITPSATINTNTWYHIAVVRNSTTTTAYLNGTSIGSSTSMNGSVSTSTVRIGRLITSYDYYFPGYISNLRFVNGSAVYTAAFTPPTSALTAITNTTLLTCQSNRFVDNSSGALTLTLNGDVSVQAFSPFAPTAAYSAATNGGSGYFDGSGDYLSVARNTAFIPTTGDFTIEAWVYPTTSGTTRFICGLLEQGTGGDWSFFINTDNTIGFYTSAGDTFGPVVTANQWNHVAMSRSGSTIYKCVNGTATTATYTANLDNGQSYPLTIGADNAGDEIPFFGWMNGVRIIKGTALYTSTTYTVPTAPFTAVTNTGFLANFTNAGITDATAKNVLETVGNAQISTTQSKFGGSSMYFDGTGDGLLLRSSDIVAVGSGDFTMEAWINPSSQVNTYGTIFGSAASGGPVLTLRGSGTASSISMNPYGSADIFNYSYTFTTGTWYHIAVSRSGTSLRVFINGTQLSTTVTNSTNWSACTVIGGIDSGAAQNYTGYIDDLRITKGYARYTANFTAPTAAFPVQ